MKLSEIKTGEMFSHNGFEYMKLVDKLYGNDYHTYTNRQAVVMRGDVKGYVHTFYYDEEVEPLSLSDIED